MDIQEENSELQEENSELKDENTELKNEIKELTRTLNHTEKMCGRLLQLVEKKYRSFQLSFAEDFEEAESILENLGASSRQD